MLHQRKFNELLENFRVELLPQIRTDYNNMDDVGKEAVSKLNNFFRGFHGLVHMANAAQEGLCEVERGNHPISDKDFSKADESGYFRLLRRSCKAFARGGDEKCGCYGTFRTSMQPFQTECFHFPCNLSKTTDSIFCFKMQHAYTSYIIT